MFMLNKLFESESESESEKIIICDDIIRKSLSIK